MHRIDQTVLQSITTLIVVIAMWNEQISNFLGRWFSGSEIVIPVGAFILIYRGLVFVYDKLFWKFLHKKDFVRGYWIYKLHNHITQNKLYGIFKISQGIEGIKVSSGEVWYCDQEPTLQNQRGTWKSISATISESELQFIFRMQTLAEEEKAGVGQEAQGVLNST